MSACPDCRFFASEVTMTRRLRNGWVRRYRKCNQCDTKWISYEIPETEVAIGDNEDLREIVIRRKKHD